MFVGYVVDRFLSKFALEYVEKERKTTKPSMSTIILQPTPGFIATALV